MFDPLNPHVPPSPAALDAMMTGRLTINSAEPYRPAPGETPPPVLSDAALSALAVDGSQGGSHLAPLPAWMTGPAPPLEGQTPAASTPLPSSAPVPTLEQTLRGILSPYTG